MNNIHNEFQFIIKNIDNFFWDVKFYYAKGFASRHYRTKTSLHNSLLTGSIHSFMMLPLNTNSTVYLNDLET